LPAFSERSSSPATYPDDSTFARVAVGSAGPDRGAGSGALQTNLVEECLFAALCPIRAGAAPSNYLCIDLPDLFIAISPAAQTKSNEPTIPTDKPIEQKTNRTCELSRRWNTSRRAGAAPSS
jgi:hypothetical protein